MPGEARTVLVIDDDLDIARLVEAVLSDEGYRVAHLHDVTPDVAIRTVGMLEPDCVLLDGESARGYGSSWELAAALTARDRPVPVSCLRDTAATCRRRARTRATAAMALASAASCANRST
jgi:DNA-binding response OmpR family regulator